MPDQQNARSGGTAKPQESYRIPALRPVLVVEPWIETDGSIQERSAGRWTGRRAAGRPDRLVHGMITHGRHTMKRRRIGNVGWLLLLLAVCSAMLPAQGDGRAMRRDIFRLGFTLGEANALMEKYPNDPSVRNLISMADNLTIQMLRNIVFEYQPPFEPDGLNNMIKRLETFDAQAAGMNSGQIAAYFENIKGGVKQSLALTYGMETQGRFNTEPTCDSCLLDLGYHLGRLSVFVVDAGSSNRSSALSGINQALNTGRQCVEHLRCAFLTMEDWNSHNVQAATTGQEIYQIRNQLETRIFGLVSSADSPFGIPSSPRISLDLSGKWGKYVITREGNQYVARAYLNFDESDRQRWGVYDGCVWFRCGTEPQHVPGFDAPVFVGKQITYGEKWGGTFWLDCYIELKSSRHFVEHYTYPDGQRWKWDYVRSSQ